MFVVLFFSTTTFCSGIRDLIFLYFDFGLKDL